MKTNNNNNNIQTFNNNKFGDLRTLLVNNIPYFIGKDVTDRLEYQNGSRDIIRHVDEEDRVNSKTQGQIDLDLGQRGGWIINESGLYSLILSSKLPNAKAFKKWVTSEVLPSIRKHGLYATDELLDNPDIAIAAFKALKEEREARKALEAENKQMQPSVKESRGKP